MLEKVELSWVPTPLTAAMIAIAIPAAISPYSIAVAPDSFFKNLTTKDFMMTCPIFLIPGTNGYFQVPDVPYYYGNI